MRGRPPTRLRRLLQRPRTKAEAEGGTDWPSTMYWTHEAGLTSIDPVAVVLCQSRSLPDGGTSRVAAFAPREHDSTVVENSRARLSARRSRRVVESRPPGVP